MQQKTWAIIVTRYGDQSYKVVLDRTTQPDDDYFHPAIWSQIVIDSAEHAMLIFELEHCIRLLCREIDAPDVAR